jgi:hypothetical protein
MALGRVPIEERQNGIHACAIVIGLIGLGIIS